MINLRRTAFHSMYARRSTKDDLKNELSPPFISFLIFFANAYDLYNSLVGQKQNKNNVMYFDYRMKKFWFLTCFYLYCMCGVHAHVYMYVYVHSCNSCMCRCTCICVHVKLKLTLGFFSFSLSYVWRQGLWLNPVLVFFLLVKKGSCSGNSLSLPSMPHAWALAIQT